MGLQASPKGFWVSGLAIVITKVKDLMRNHGMEKIVEPTARGTAEKDCALVCLGYGGFCASTVLMGVYLMEAPVGL